MDRGEGHHILYSLESRVTINFPFKSSFIKIFTMKLFVVPVFLQFSSASPIVDNNGDSTVNILRRDKLQETSKGFHRNSEHVQLAKNQMVSPPDQYFAQGKPRRSFQESLDPKYNSKKI